MKKKAGVFKAYNELYGLSLVRPHRTVTFRGFADGELSAADAAMVVPHDGATNGNGSGQWPQRPAARASGPGRRAPEAKLTEIRGRGSAPRP